MRVLVYMAVIVVIIFSFEQHATVYEIQLYYIHSYMQVKRNHIVIASFVSTIFIIRMCINNYMLLSPLSRVYVASSLGIWHHHLSSTYIANNKNQVFVFILLMSFLINACSFSGYYALALCTNFTYECTCITSYSNERCTALYSCSLREHSILWPVNRC